jgi:light-regulated signal transduction histidine kinase (bacteriophytochrome)
VRKAQLDFSALAEMVAAQLMESSERQVEWRIQPGVTAFGDARLLRIVLENLFGNALKFTSKQDRSIIEFGQEVTERGIVYYVCDNGAGFEMEYAGKLFAAFQRLHSPQEYPGTGIGLATVRRIVNRHGGEIRATGERGRGAKFSFTLDS